MTNDLDGIVARAMKTARETRRLEIGRGALAHAPMVWAQEFGSKPALIVADPSTYAAAGQQVSAAFRRAGLPVLDPFIYTEPELHAEHEHVVALEAALRAQPEAIPVAVGTGTINDLTKLAAHRVGRRYLALGTAASMDGYTAYGASITFNGAKQTFPCPAPAAVIADLDVIAAAPPDLNAAGYADLMAKSTAGADWLLSDALGLEPINIGAWDLVQGPLRVALARPAGVPAGDLAALKPLTQGLMLGGLAMQWARTSHVASGAEHLFSHLWDMQHHAHNGKTPWHGFKVAIGTLALTALYEYVLALPLDAFDPDRARPEWPAPDALDQRVCDLFPADDLRTVALTESRAKALSRADWRDQLAALGRLWPALRAKLKAQLIPFTELKEMLRLAGAPVEPEQIGISRPRLRQSFWLASFLRRRFTVLDLAARAGVLEPALDRLFAPGGRLAAPQP